MKIDWSSRGRPRIYAITVLGTAICIAVAFVFDSYTPSTGTWEWGSDPWNNVIIPLLLAPPFFFLLLSKMRELAIAHQELMSVASTDSLTALLNRRAFTEMVDGYLKRVEQANGPPRGALLVIDVDHFKSINDSFGHESGDEALKLIAGTITANVRDTDLVGRIGGEEFCVFIPGQTPDRVVTAAERIRAAVNEAEFVANGERRTLTVSVGGITFDRAAPFSDLYRMADQYLYDAKRNGRNRVELAPFDANPDIMPTMH